MIIDTYTGAIYLGYWNTGVMRYLIEQGKEDAKKERLRIEKIRNVQPVDATMGGRIRDDGLGEKLDIIEEPKKIEDDEKGRHVNYLA
jgi:hypothetical protein